MDVELTPSEENESRDGSYQLDSAGIGEENNNWVHVHTELAWRRRAQAPFFSALFCVVTIVLYISSTASSSHEETKNIDSLFAVSTVRVGAGALAPIRSPAKMSRSNLHRVNAANVPRPVPSAGSTQFSPQMRAHYLSTSASTVPEVGEMWERDITGGSENLLVNGKETEVPVEGAEGSYVSNGYNKPPIHKLPQRLVNGKLVPITSSSTVRENVQVMVDLPMTLPSLAYQEIFTQIDPNEKPLDESVQQNIHIVNNKV